MRDKIILHLYLLCYLRQIIGVESVLYDLTTISAL